MPSPAASPSSWSPEFSTRPEIAGTFGVVASTHWLASAVGMAVLERGGNAFDAAAAAGFTLQVVEPHLNGPGGDCPIILHSARADAEEVICGQGVAPAAATIAHFEQLGLDLVPGTGLLPAVVPGAFDAWLSMLERHGTWRLADVLSFAIGYAGHGFPLVPRISATINRMQPLFAEWPSSRETWLPGGNVPDAGSLFRNPDLAATYARILREAAGGTREQEIARARALWYQGFIAETVGAFYQSELLDTSNRRHRGLLCAQDFAEWRAGVEPALAYEYGRYRVLKCGPWSQGGAFLQTLALLKGIDIAAMDFLGADFIHHVVEAQKLAFADREAFYGDPDFSAVPMDVLLSDSYNEGRRALIGAEASMALRPGTVAGRTPWVDHEAHLRVPELYGGNLGAGEPTVARLGAIGGDTCHVDVIDRDGNMVAATPSGGWLQSSPVVPGFGFPLSTRGQMFWLKPGLPNSLEPRKRPRTTLSPGFALRDGRPWMAFGTPGGEQQDQWACAFFLRMVHHGLDIQQAIDAPGFHTEHWPSSFWPRPARPGRVVIEERFGSEVAAALAARGHAVETGPAWSEGRLSAARIEGGLMKAGANPRGMQGYAVGR
ncbi:MAG: gamma-glutamyltransferase family protein [Acetobacteraceae bacterium]|nr:gamma-glutamyltransferase family protein [Acetobacteraceae bacterium]